MKKATFIFGMLLISVYGYLQNYLAAKRLEKFWGYINEGGSWNGNSQYVRLHNYGEPMAVVQAGKVWIFIDKKEPAPSIPNLTTYLIL